MFNSYFSLPSFAKINWSLRILCKRADGYHEIRTVLQTISLQDDLHFAECNGDDIALSCDDPLIPTDDSNLIIRAAQLLRAHAGVRKGAVIRLEKRIPARGGLGGGSSNAAVTLLALTKLWELNTNDGDLAKIASRLGADVPFFLLGGRALGEGIGTTLTHESDVISRQLLIVTPNVSVSTADAYRAWDAAALTTSESNPILAISRTEADFSDSNQWSKYDQLANDFEQVIFDIEPEIWRAKNALLQAGARRALLAGSGSSVFGIFDDPEAQRRAAATLRAESGWRIFSCVTLSHDDYQRALGSVALGRINEGS